MGFVRRHAVGLLALCVALGGTSYAVTAKKTFVASDGTITACAKKRTGTVRLVVAGKRCRKSEQRVRWSQRGPAGTNGTPGTNGAAGSIQGAAAGGDLAGAYPDPTIAAPAAPVLVADNPAGATDPCFPGSGAAATMVFCGTSAKHWTNGSAPTPGVHVGVDRLGQVHIRGLTALNTGMIGGDTALFILPPGLRPTHFLDFPSITEQAVGVNEHAAVLQVETDGFVGIYSSSPSTDNQVVIGDVSFRPGD